MIKQFLSSKLNDEKINISLLILRLAAGLIMVPHGYGKLTNFSEIQPKFMNFMGMSREISLALTIGAEFFCALLLIVGLFTRIALIPLIVTMLVAVFSAHNNEIFGEGQLAFLYLATFVCLFIAGPGKWSLDNLLWKK